MQEVYIVTEVSLFQEEDGEFGDDGYEISNVTKVFNTKSKAEKYVSDHEPDDEDEDPNNWYRIQEFKVE